MEAKLNKYRHHDTKGRGGGGGGEGCVSEREGGGVGVRNGMLVVEEEQID